MKISTPYTGGRRSDVPAPHERRRRSNFDV
jgi:hypothetical protein